jgi:hypothetical protein
MVEGTLAGPFQFTSTSYVAASARELSAHTMAMHAILTFSMAVLIVAQALRR